MAADEAGPAAIVLPLDAGGVAPALRVATRLRDEGLADRARAGGRSLKALLRVADRRRARLAIIVGEDELRRGARPCATSPRHADHRQALALDAPASGARALGARYLETPA